MAVEAPPIVIKKIKKGGHGHHGGAWKVAFADFVTAMMAFFMLMWLMGSTTPEQKAAIANYMNNPLATAGQGGAGANPVLDGGAGILDGNGPTPSIQGPTTDLPPPDQASGSPSAEQAEEIAAQAERERMEELREQLRAAVDASEALKPFKDQLLLDVTSEGLRIQIVDKENRPMFAQGSPVLESYTRELLHAVAKVIDQVPNRISISGHTDQTPYASSNGYSNWELSADRANAARREIIAGGISEAKIGRVVGLASSVLFDKENPFSPVNRRISIIVMNKAAEEAVNQGEGSTASTDVTPTAPDAVEAYAAEPPGASPANEHTSAATAEPATATAEPATTTAEPGTPTAEPGAKPMPADGPVPPTVPAEVPLPPQPMKKKIVKLATGA